jgi:catechol 2,3-dioxygenase-like lactoylglutathione lyase family enzyme
MVVNASQHVGIRVRDIDRSAQFYIDAFGAHYLTLPFEVADDPGMEALFGGHPGLKVKVCILGFEQGGIVELFQFLEPSRPTGPEDPTQAMLMHWCIQVDDVEAALEKALSHGASLVQPMGDWGGTKYVYCYDPDGNVFELLETSMEDTARRTIELFPGAAPPA